MRLINYERMLQMNITIRKCMISDAPYIRSLSEEILGFEYPIEKFEENIRRLMGDPSNCIYVAENQGTVLGFAHVCDFDILYGPNLKVLRAIAVDANYRRYGIASKLMEAAEGWAKRHGAEGMRIYGGADRKDATPFYKTCGYEIVKAEVQYKKDFKD